MSSKLQYFLVLFSTSRQNRTVDLSGSDFCPLNVDHKEHADMRIIAIDTLEVLNSEKSRAQQTAGTSWPSGKGIRCRVLARYATLA